LGRLRGVLEAADGCREGFELIAAELRVVVAESVGDVLRRGAGDSKVTVLYETANGTGGGRRV
jgi:hypothetical protein